MRCAAYVVWATTATAIASHLRPRRGRHPTILDGLLYHESDLRIAEHYTDTAGFTDHVFALCHLLGFRFAPRIRDLADRRIYVPQKGSTYPALRNLVGGTLNDALMSTQCKEVLRLATSIKLRLGLTKSSFPSLP